MEKQLLESYHRTHKKLDIEFENITLTVNVKEGTKQIIKGASGIFKSGELTAIMGPSGAGKTSLLNILTGYQKSGVEGIIRCTNGQKQKKGSSQYKKHSSYILQDDHLLKYFTVYEIMYSTTKLKIANLTNNAIDYLVDDILSTLGMINHKSTKCGDLSGGQKKRLSVALELIDDPEIIFLDEPTTGLDSSSSRQCVEMLKSLAEKGRTIICTIHQPSAPLFVTFNHVYVMAAGKCMYQGPPESIVSFLSTVGFICPQYHNPSDFMLEIANGEYGNCIDELAKAAELRRRTNNNYKEKDENIQIEETNCSKINSVENENNTNFYVKKKPTEWQKLLILMKKQLVRTSRDWAVAKLKFILHFLVGIFLGVFYLNCGNDGSKSISNLSLLLISLVYLSYTSLMPAVLRFPSELSLIKKEHFNRWYELRTYYIAVLMVDAPLQVVFSFVYIIGPYILSTQPLEMSRFFMTLLIMSLASLISSAFGIIFGTIVNPINGTFFGALMTSINIALSGFLCLYAHMNKVMYVASFFSYISICMQSVLQAIYGYNRGALNCPEEEDYCIYTTPEKILEDFDMNTCSYWIKVVVLFGLLLVLRLTGYCTLKRTLKPL